LCVEKTHLNTFCETKEPKVTLGSSI